MTRALSDEVQEITGRPYSAETLAKRWSCTAHHVRDLIARGELDCFRIGRLIRIPASEVDRIEGVSQDQGKSGWKRGLERVRETQAR